MKIREITAFSKNLELTRPYTIAYKTISNVENIFLIITLENGIVGVGAANPDKYVVGESPAGNTGKLSIELLSFVHWQGHS